MCTYQKAKTAAHAHAQRENSSDFKFKKIWAEVTFQGFHNGDRYGFTKFVSKCLNLEVSTNHLDHTNSFALLEPHFSNVFQLGIYKKERQMPMCKKFSRRIW